MDNQIVLLAIAGAAIYFMTRPAPAAPAPVYVAPPPERSPGIGERIGGNIGGIVDAIIEEIA